MWSLPLVMLVGCSSYRSFAELDNDASSVPTPLGVAFVSQFKMVNDGPGFTTKKSEQVTRQFASSLPCDELQRTWADALTSAHRRFRIANYPHAFSAFGSLGIEITDRPEVLGVTIGTDDGRCSKPFVYAYNRPHYRLR